MEDQDIAAVPPPKEEPKVDSVEEDMKTEEPAPPAPAPSEENKPTDIDIPIEPKIEDNNTTEEDAAAAIIFRYENGGYCRICRCPVCCNR